MVTRKEAYETTIRAYRGERCTKCGRQVFSIEWSEDGTVYGHCGWCDHVSILGREYWPLQFELENDDQEELPF